MARSSTQPCPSISNRLQHAMTCSRATHEKIDRASANCLQKNGGEEGLLPLDAAFMPHCIVHTGGTANLIHRRTAETKCTAVNVGSRRNLGCGSQASYSSRGGIVSQARGADDQHTIVVEGASRQQAAFPSPHRQSFPRDVLRAHQSFSPNYLTVDPHLPARHPALCKRIEYTRIRQERLQASGCDCQNRIRTRTATVPHAATTLQKNLGPSKPFPETAETGAMPTE